MAAALRRSLRIPLFRRRFSALSTAATTATSPTPSSDPISAAKSAIRSESDPDRLVSLFESAAHDPSFYDDRPIYRFSIQKLARHHRPDLIERLLEGAKSNPDPPKSEGFLLRLLSLYSEAGMPDHAFRTFEAMPGLGCRRTDRSLCALLSAFLKNDCVDRLQDVFDRAAVEFGIAPGIASYNVLLRALCSIDEVEKARALLDEMPDKGVEPDIICYNTVLEGYLKKGDYSGFDEFLKEFNRKKFSPNVGTFNCRIAALCAQGKSLQAEELLDVMQSKTIQPNRLSFNTLIDGFCKEGNMDSAMKVFERMKGFMRPDDTRVSPDFKTYTTLLEDLVEKGEFGKGVEICKECLKKKWAPPFETVKGLIDGLVKSSRVNEAKDVISRMGKGIKGDARDAWKKIEESFSL
ncbi:small ribosomal subunit protein mS78 (rPPR3a) [Musa acuminata AAA Group]|uniref:small ribosomal subunit protein mS78 (rPPR3a) n=1 Tax=Musa acuminata AAA Group TaxID=214697 RepID=UPI0031D89323